MYIDSPNISGSLNITGSLLLNGTAVTASGGGGGSGAGFPGIIVSILVKNLKKKIKVHLYEKSHHKSSFLREVSRKLNLDTEVIQKDVFEITELKAGTIMARAFKPMPIILDLIHKNFSSYNIRL